MSRIHQRIGAAVQRLERELAAIVGSATVAELEVLFGPPPSAFLPLPFLGGRPGPKRDAARAVVGLVVEHFGDAAKAAEWFATPNPGLGYIQPRDLLAMGRGENLLAYVEAAIEEGRGPPPGKAVRALRGRTPTRTRK